MKHRLQAYYDFFGEPLSPWVRGLLFLSILPVYFAFQGPLWNMAFTSNQYPDPLRMSIHVDHLEGQKTPNRDDLREINSLNHYIGMRPLLESDFAEFLWLPFAIGGFVLLTMRVIVFGRLRDLVDLTVLYVYFGLFSMWDFYNKLKSYGHNLDPEAAIKVDPFIPPLLGKEQIANFSVESYPDIAAYALSAVGALYCLALLLAVWTAWRHYRAELKAAS